MSVYIPFEIQTEIIKRLPVKSLMQSRLLSKQFKSLIDSPKFIADYNRYQSRPPQLLLRYHQNRADRYYRFLSITDDNCFPQHSFTTPTPHAFRSLKNPRFVGSSNGLLCFYGEDRKPAGKFPHSKKRLVVIWNPSLVKYVEIIVPVLYDIYSCILGFGVHPNTNDPVIVKFNDFYYPFVEVFTLSSRVWRSPRSNVPRKSLYFRWSQVTMDGFIYWCAVDTINRGNAADSVSYNIILSFDMRSEKFVEINLPDYLAPYRSDRPLALLKLRESLVVLENYYDVGKTICNIWKMTTGVMNSCTKLFTVSLQHPSLKTVLGFRTTSEPIMGESMDGREESENLQVYHTSVEEIKGFATSGQLGSLFVSSYTETLLLQDQENHDHIPIKFS